MAVYVSNYSSSQQQVSWDVPAAFAIVTGRTQLQRSTNGGGYVSVSIGGSEWFHYGTRLVRVNSVSGSSYRYRVRFRTTNQFNVDTYSDYYYSSTLTFYPPGGGSVPSDPTPPDDPAPVWAPPQNLKITSLADTSIKLTWTLPRSYQALYANVYRNSGNVTGSISLASNATSLTDSTYPRAHAIMAYHIVGQIAPGDLAYSAGARIRTTPSPPPAISVARYEGVGISVTWTRPTNWDLVWQWLDIQRWDNVSNAWSNLVVGMAENTTSLTDFDVIPSREYRYRVRARVNTGSFERVSAWATSATIRLLSMYVKIGGSWKSVSTIGARIGGSWKDFAGVWVKVGGAWKQV